jgi:hypothetical protein
MKQGAVGYERGIRPLFREKDVGSMSMALDLASYSDVLRRSFRQASGFSSRIMVGSNSDTVG